MTTGTSPGGKDRVDDMPTAAQLNSMAAAHRIYSRSYEECQRKIRKNRLFKKIAWAIFWFSMILSYVGINAYTGSPAFAAILALCISALQHQVWEGVLKRSWSTLFKPDLNEDGKVTPDEWLRLASYWGWVILSMTLDVGTNMLAIDAPALGQLPFQLAGMFFGRSNVLPAEAGAFAVFAYVVVTFIIALLFSIGDEVMHSLADERIAQLKAELPRLKRQAAIIQGQYEAAVGFSYEYLLRAEEKGRVSGKNHPI
jgi:hypothetical protein